MRIAAAYLREFEPFEDQSVVFAPKQSPELAEVHFFVGQNGTGKTRLLSLLAATCGNPDELAYRTSVFKSTVVVQRNAPANDFQYARAHDRLSTSEPIEKVLDQIRSLKGVPFLPTQLPLIDPSETVSMAFRSIPTMHDQKVRPMDPVKWPGAIPKEFLKFDHHAAEMQPLCQALTNLKIKVGIVSAERPNPTDRTVRLVRALDMAIRSITSQDWILTLGQSGGEMTLKVSWTGKEMKFQHLPDGLRSVVGWLASIVCKLDMLLPDIENPLEMPLILLLDEPDAHLHPAWQRKLIPAVQRLLPNAQIFVATHSPFVISSVNEGYIYVFKADKDGKVTIDPAKPCGLGDSYIDVVEDVLGITERFDPETEELLKKFRDKRDAAQGSFSEPELGELEALADLVALRGDTLRFMMGREMAQIRSHMKSKAG